MSHACPHCQSRDLANDGTSSSQLRCRACAHAFVPDGAQRHVSDPQVAEVLARISGDVRLNLGCGRFPTAGWINIDSIKLPEVDLVADLESGVLPFPDDSVTEFAASHLLEHIRNSLGLMQEIHRIAKPGAKAVFRVPYGSSDDADTDPTHVRRYFWGSWGYFSQPYYWRADYGYRGDWEVEDLLLIVKDQYRGQSWADVFQAVEDKRNVVKEMVVTLVAVKPIRPPLRGLQKQSVIRFATET